jgi:hypothetical protein
MEKPHSLQRVPFGFIIEMVRMEFMPCHPLTANRHYR